MTATKNYVCRFYVNVVFELKDNVNDNNKFGISYELTPFMATKLKCTDSSHNLPKHFINYYNMSEYIQNYDDYNQLYGYISSVNIMSSHIFTINNIKNIILTDLINAIGITIESNTNLDIFVNQMNKIISTEQHPLYTKDNFLRMCSSYDKTDRGEAEFELLYENIKKDLTRRRFLFGIT